jgi:hypothetical protein
MYPLSARSMVGVMTVVMMMMKRSYSGLAAEGR